VHKYSYRPINKSIIIENSKISYPGGFKIPENVLKRRTINILDQVRKVESNIFEESANNNNYKEKIYKDLNLPNENQRYDFGQIENKKEEVTKGIISSINSEIERLQLYSENFRCRKAEMDSSKTNKEYSTENNTNNVYKDMTVIKGDHEKIQAFTNVDSHLGELSMEELEDIIVK